MTVADQYEITALLEQSFHTLLIRFPQLVKWMMQQNNTDMSVSDEGIVQSSLRLGLSYDDCVLLSTVSHPRGIESKNSNTSSVCTLANLKGTHVEVVFVIEDKVLFGEEVVDEFGVVVQAAKKETTIVW